jgi:hypothetical protein
VSQSGAGGRAHFFSGAQSQDRPNRDTVVPGPNDDDEEHPEEEDTESTSPDAGGRKDPLKRRAPSSTGQSTIEKTHHKAAEKALETHQENVRQFQDKLISLETERLKLMWKRNTRKDERHDAKEAHLRQKDDNKAAYLLKKDAHEEARLQKEAKLEEERLKLDCDRVDLEAETMEHEYLDREAQCKSQLERVQVQSNLEMEKLKLQMKMQEMELWRMELEAQMKFGGGGGGSQDV